MAAPQRISNANAVRIVRTVTDLDALSPHWERLTDGATEPGSRFLWARTSAETLADSEPHVVVVGDPAGGDRAAGPLPRPGRHPHLAGRAAA